MMAQVAKVSAAEKSNKSSQPAKSKPRRVLLDTPMKKYIVHHDPNQWDDDMKSAGETN